MKKILVTLIAGALLIIGGGYTWYNYEYGGQEYYVQIHIDGDKISSKTTDGGTWQGFNYKQKGYADSGKEKDLEFTSIHNLKHDAYLKVTYNNKNGVTKWEEVQRKDVPQKALNNI
ncbi:YxeA family protein [Lactococcus petauri]|uniref:YxeA family protein n=1 Tax=Lactococcus petauri TaxID=1940789 RepID=UPI001BD031EB|nr:YxeA family protein [Lactococcus petauri]MBS4459873.1 YxeA family protein [Lactococcus petauri]